MALVTLAVLFGPLVLSCHPDCVTCNGQGSANQCTSCANNAYLNSTPRGNCVCMAGSSTATDAQHCSPIACDPTCLSCVGNLSSQCTSCRAHASGAPGTCACTSGYFPNPTSASCTSCDPSCATCSGGLTSQCLSCKANANGAPGICVCLSGFYPDPTPALCTICEVTCTACNGAGAGACTSCHAGAGLASGSPGPCSCLAGSVPNPNSAHCTLATACHFSCSACSTPMDSSQCTNCYANASLVSNPGPCLCSNNAVPTPDVANCALCHLTCLNCVQANDSSQCTGCHGLAILSSIAPSSCLCPSSAFPSPNVTNCVLCHSTCGSCIWPGGPSECTSCLDLAALAASSPSECRCSEGAFPSPDSAHCVQCHVSCMLCASVGESGCSKCYGNAYFSGPPPSACHCSPGFYPSPDASKCVECSIECATCLNSSDCESCKSGAYLSAGKCLCPLGAFPSPDASFCAPCQPGCQVCAVPGCIQCLDSYYLHTGNCVQVCPKPFLGLSGLCEPGEWTPPVPSLFVDITNDLQISFDRDMVLNLTAVDISVEVTANSSAYAVVWSSPVIESNQSFYVSLRINTTYLPAENWVNFTFLRPQFVRDGNGTSISVSSLLGVLSPIGLFPVSNHSNVLALQLASLLGTSTLTAALVGSLFSSKPGSIWSILNQMELITFIPMTAIPLHADFTDALNALVLEAMLPDYFQPIQEEGLECDLAIDFSHNYKVHSRYFVSNVRMMLGAGVVLMLFFGGIRILSKLKVPTCERMLKYAHWKVPIRWWLQAYLHILVFSCLQLTITYSASCLHSFYMDLNLVLSVLGLCTALISPLFLLLFLPKHSAEVTQRADAAFNQRWDELYKHLAPSSFTASLFPAVFLLRRLLFGLSIAFLYEWPKAQAVVGTSLAFAVLLYVTLGRPVEGKMEWTGEIVVETGTFVVFALSACFAFGPGKKVQEAMSAVAVWTVVGTVLSNGVVSVVKSFLAVKEVCKEYSLKRRIQLASLPAPALRATRVSSLRIP